MNNCVLHFFLCVDLLIDRDTVLQLLGNLKSLLHDQESPFTSNLNIQMIPKDFSHIVVFVT